MLVLYGPTKTGKTDLAIKLAKKLNTELISADSRQVYKGLDIGTGKVSFDSKIAKHKGCWIVDGIKINGFDLVEPQAQFTVSDFIRFASASMTRITESDRLPIVVGGTGFYIKALIDGIGTLGILADQKLRRVLEKLSTLDLYQKLLDLDKKRAQKMNKSDRANPRRLIRAIEVSLSHQKFTTTCNQLPITNYQLICLTAPNEYLYQRADKWLEIRLENGMIEEVKILLKKVDPLWLENLGLEYRWITRYLMGKINLNLVKQRLKGDIHSFIRRQKTFFNQFKEKEVYDISKRNWQDILEKSMGL